MVLRRPIYWNILTFNAGFLNAGSLLAVGSFVTHVTGFATLFGIELARGQSTLAFGILSVPVFFVVGSFLAGLFTERRLARRLQPRYDWVFGLMSLCLFLAIFAGELPEFGIYTLSTRLHLKESYLLLALLSLSSGLQNGAVTVASQRSIRTTHLTGITTDLGLELARTRDLRFEWASSFHKLLTIGSFILGSTFGAILFLKAKYFGFLLPALLAGAFAWRHRR